ncbi:hypothetical protein PBRA_008360 [Plasmodiophora brassicae]|uniref:Uncharacterized protein n=1 Tax=Plasmodiophora brassicae TaxID=37360 RepID=A0A0G4J092_PLABS|nr:hypothetical protein PBRA_008360 [Plasmodiophora brassicae]
MKAHLHPRENRRRTSPATCKSRQQQRSPERIPTTNTQAILAYHFYRQRENLSSSAVKSSSVPCRDLLRLWSLTTLNVVGYVTTFTIRMAGRGRALSFLEGRVHETGSAFRGSVPL